MSSLSPTERLGTRIADKYLLMSVLGRGGMGVVYEAVHLWTGRRVAVKLIDTGDGTDPDLACRFLNEARAATRIAHPNVVEVLDMGRGEDGIVYQALELLEGQTLAALLAERGRLSSSEAITTLLPVMDALGRAHELGIIHRDVKPANVFLRRRLQQPAQPILLDFGVAKLLEDHGLSTASSAVLGTPHYMAPEQALGSEITPASDVWAMGTVLFECIAGELPFGRRTPTAYVARMLREPAPSLAQLSRDCPAQVVAAVDRALAREPAHRFGSMHALAEALRVPTRAQPAAGFWRSITAKLFAQA